MVLGHCSVMAASDSNSVRGGIFSLECSSNFSVQHLNFLESPMVITTGFLLVGMAPIGGRTSGALQLGFCILVALYCSINSYNF